MDLSFERGEEIGREGRQLPAEHYNKIRLLYSRAGGNPLFVPLRGMQYLAIIDSEEIVFVDSLHKSQVAIAWTDFRPQGRSRLDDAVPYVARYYSPDTLQIMPRLQSEFLVALRQLRDRQSKPQTAKVIILPARGHQS